MEPNSHYEINIEAEKIELEIQKLKLDILKRFSSYLKEGVRAEQAETLKAISELIKAI